MLKNVSFSSVVASLPVLLYSLLLPKPSVCWFVLFILILIRPILITKLNCLDQSKCVSLAWQSGSASNSMEAHSNPHQVTSNLHWRQLSSLLDLLKAICGFNFRLLEREPFFGAS